MAESLILEANRIAMSLLTVCAARSRSPSQANPPADFA